MCVCDIVIGLCTTLGRPVMNAEANRYVLNSELVLCPGFGAIPPDYLFLCYRYVFWCYIASVAPVLC